MHNSVVIYHITQGFDNLADNVLSRCLLNTPASLVKVVRQASSTNVLHDKRPFHFCYVSLHKEFFKGLPELDDVFLQLAQLNRVDT
jgi:hypothetical protein